MSILQILQRSILLVSCGLMNKAPLYAQPDVSWSRVYGGSAFEDFKDAVATSDGGYVAVGTTLSVNGAVTDHHGGSDVWAVRTDASGALLWQRALGGSGFDEGYGVVRTADNGFLVVGSTNSDDGDVSENLGGGDLWAVKLSAMGSIVWERVYGGSDGEGAFAVLAQNDGTFVLAGFTQSEDGDITESFGGLTDIWVIRISAAGDLLQQRSFGGSSNEDAFAICPAADGAFVFAGRTSSQDGDVGDNDHVVDDIWVVKFTFEDGVLWEHTYGADEGYELGFSIAPDNEGGYWVLGSADLEGDDVQGLHGWQDGWVLRLNAAGELLLQRCLGGSGDDSLSGVLVLDGGDALVCGSTDSSDGDVQSSIGGRDAWLVRLSTGGDVRWERCYGGSSGEAFRALMDHGNGRYTLAGSSASSNGDVPSNQGSDDCWLMELEPDITSVKEPMDVEALQLAPNPATTSLFIQHELATEATLSIHDSRGALVRMAQGFYPARLMVPMHDLMPGLYRISLISGERIRASSFVKE